LRDPRYWRAPSSSAFCRSVICDTSLRPGGRTEHQLSRTLGAPRFHPPLQGPELCPGGVEVGQQLR